MNASISNEPARRLAAKLGRWSARHRGKAILLWLAVLFVGLTAAGVGSKKLSAAGEAT
jgi:uncharacterized membrane protein YdfJ with MMPL/SSD domain